MPKPLLLFGFLLVLLIVRFHTHYTSRKASNYVDGQQVSFEGGISQEPKVIGAYQTFWVDDGKNEKILVKTYKYPQYFYTQTIKISGILKKQVLKDERLMTTIFFPQIEAKKNDQNPLLAVITVLRQQFVNFFNKTLPPISSSLLLGIVFGVRGEFPKNFADSLRVSGVMHVIAASGMNVTMVAGFFSSIFVLFFKRQTAVILSIIGIIFYAFLAGLEPSIIRASIMGALAFSAQILGRQTLALYSLFITGYSMLFISPELVGDVGFQLSFLSTLGLLTLKSLFEVGKAKQFVQRSIIGDDLTTTISAQIATLPILFTNFGSYSLWSIIVNGLVLWTIPILMALGGLGAIVGLIFEPIGRIFLYLSLPFLLLFEKLIVFFSQLPGQLDLAEEWPWPLTLGYYLLLAAVVLKAKTLKQSK